VKRAVFAYSNISPSTGNPDISGVGMAIGYLMSSILSFALAINLVFLAHLRRDGEEWQWFRFVRNKVASVFYECALFLAFSVQIASIIVLAKANFGISTNGMGAITLKITWVVSLWTLLPLCFEAFVDRKWRASLSNKSKVAVGNHVRRKEQEESALNESKKRELDLDNEDIAQRIVELEHSRKFVIFALCWLLSLYPFMSRMIATFGKLIPFTFKRLNCPNRDGRH
jgi:hypothetical protein